MWILLFNIFDHVDLEDWVALRWVLEAHERDTTLIYRAPLNPKFHIWQLGGHLKHAKCFQTSASVLTSTTTSTPLCTSRSNRYLSSLWVPIAAPHSSCLRESFDARGKSLFFFRSVRAMMDTREPSSFTMGSLPAGGDCRGSEHDMVLIHVKSRFLTEVIYPPHLFYSSGGFHWLLSASLQRERPLDPPALSSPGDTGRGGGVLRWHAC